ncbi:MAG: DMT family transporter, partial [Thermoflexus sp.]|uniref:DMT family transporter n=1 Tax=Thermoflexus sp. TaxID=1969742 RepID=UPI0025FBFF5E
MASRAFPHAYPSGRAYLALALGILCISSSAIFVKWAAVPGPASAFYRLLFAGIVMLPAWLARRPAKVSTGDLRWILMAGLFFALDLALWNTALLKTSAASATLLANAAPLWVGLGAWLFFRERWGGGFWLGMGLAFLGIGVVFGGDLGRHLHLGAGDLLAVLASLFYAAYLLSTQRIRERTDVFTLMALSMVVGSIFLYGLCRAMGVPLTCYSKRAWLALLGLGLIAQAGGWLAINEALGHLRASLVSVSLLAQPVLTALLAIPLLGESLSLEQIVGGLLVL